MKFLGFSFFPDGVSGFFAAKMILPLGAVQNFSVSGYFKPF